MSQHTSDTSQHTKGLLTCGLAAQQTEGVAEKVKAADKDVEKQQDAH